MLCSAIVKIVAIDGRYDGMGKPQLFDRLGDAGGLGGIECAGEPGPDIAEGAGTRASVAHDHEGRVFFLPAFADIGAARLLADGHELMFLDNFACRFPLRRARRLDPDPGGLARHRLIGPLRLFRVAWRGVGLAVIIKQAGGV